MYFGEKKLSRALGKIRNRAHPGDRARKRQEGWPSSEGGTIEVSVYKRGRCVVVQIPICGAGDPRILKERQQDSRKGSRACPSAPIGGRFQSNRKAAGSAIVFSGR